MINFISQKLSVSSPLTDTENFAKNLVNKKLTDRLQSMFGDKFCIEHPDFQNEIIVNGNNETDVMTVKSYCCPDFKSKLDMLAKNQNPFVDQ